MEEPMTVQEVYSDLTPAAFAVWIRLTVASEKEIVDRNSIAKTLDYSLSQTNIILTELRRKGYIKLKRYGNTKRRSKLLFRKKTIISGPSNFIKLSNLVSQTDEYSANEVQLLNNNISKENNNFRRNNTIFNKNNKNIENDKIDKILTTEILHPKNKMLENNTLSKEKQVNFKDIDGGVKNGHFSKKTKSFSKTHGTPINKGPKKKKITSNSKNKLQRKNINSQIKDSKISIKKSHKKCKISGDGNSQKRQKNNNRKISDEKIRFIKIRKNKNNIKKDTNNTNNSMFNISNIGNKLDINKLKVKTKQEKEKRKIREKDKLLSNRRSRSDRRLRDNLSQVNNTYQDDQDNMFDWNRINGDDSFFKFELTENEREKFIEILEWKKEDKRKKKTKEKIKEEKEKYKLQKNVLNKIGNEFAIIYSRYRKLVQETKGNKRNFKVYKDEMKYAQKAGCWCVLKGILPTDLLKYWHENISDFANANMKVPPLSFLSSSVNVETAVCSSEELRTEEEISNHSFWDVSKLHPKLRIGLTNAGMNVQKYSDRYLLTVQSAAQTIAGDHDIFMAEHIRKMATWAAVNLYGWTQK